MRWGNGKTPPYKGAVIAPKKKLIEETAIGGGGNTPSGEAAEGANKEKAVCDRKRGP